MDDNKSQKIPNVKIILIGNAFVGKTSIIERFSSGNFNENIRPTIGIGSINKLLTINDNTKIMCNLWDTAGKEVYLSLNKECFRDAFIVCLVYDITDEKSFEDIDKIWLPFLRENGEKYIILGLVGNKSDLYTNEKVDESKARDYAKTINASFLLSSAKNGDNIDILFENLVSKYLDQKFINKIISLKKERGENFNVNIGNSGKNKKKKGCC